MVNVITVSKKVKNLRIEKGLTQEKLAALADLSIVTVRNIEQRSNGCPSFKTLAKLAEALDVTVNDLID